MANAMRIGSTFTALGLIGMLAACASPGQQHASRASVFGDKVDSSNIGLATKAQAYLEDRRNSLLEPILTEVREAIKVVAKENGYLMVFDISSGAMLFAAETDDVTELVKKKWACKP